MMRGTFTDFFVPGLILTCLGVLQAMAFVAVLLHARSDWLFAGLATGGLIVWMIVEMLVLGSVHWAHLIWGLPALVGGVLALPLVPRGGRAPGNARRVRH